MSTSTSSSILKNRKRDYIVAFFFNNFITLKDINTYLTIIFIVYSIYTLFNSTISFFSKSYASISFIWFISEITIIIISIYIAKKYAFLKKINNNGNYELEMIRRPKEINEGRSVLLRWDFMGVFFSNLFGKINSIPLPYPLRAPLYQVWAFIFGANLSECGQKLSSYRSLQEFFSRSLKDGVRPISSALLVSPVDGKISLFGRVESDKVEQVKGVTYSLTEFLGEDIITAIDRKTSGNSSKRRDSQPIGSSFGNLNDDRQQSLSVSFSAVSLTTKEDSDDDSDDDSVSIFSSASQKMSITSVNSFNSLFHIVIYLAPGDYHRIHAPASFSISNVRHFPGTLFPISPIVARLIPNLFALNERVVLKGSWEYGFFSLTAVGAYNVGSMTFSFEDSVVTNRLRRDYHNPNLSYGGCGCYAYNFEYNPPIQITKGEEIGKFHLGSTVVLVFEAPFNAARDIFQFAKSMGDIVKMGESLGNVEI